MKYLGLVVARKGSKGIPNKNLRTLSGKPLVQYSFESGVNAQRVEEVHVSTDDERITELAVKSGVLSYYERPAELAADSSSVIDVILYHLKWLEVNGLPIPENVVLLQPTSPIRSRNLIDNCIEAFERSGKNSLIAVSRCSQHPYEMFEVSKGKLVYINEKPKRRQEYPDYFFITGSVYIASVKFIKDSKKLFDEYSETYIISDEEAVDVDIEHDLLLAEFFLSVMNGKNKEEY